VAALYLRWRQLDQYSPLLLLLVPVSLTYPAHMLPLIQRWLCTRRSMRACPLLHAIMRVCAYARDARDAREVRMKRRLGGSSSALVALGALDDNETRVMLMTTDGT